MTVTTVGRRVGVRVDGDARRVAGGRGVVVGRAPVGVGMRDESSAVIGRRWPRGSD